MSARRGMDPLPSSLRPSLRPIAPGMTGRYTKIDSSGSGPACTIWMREVRLQQYWEPNSLYRDRSCPKGKLLCLVADERR